MNTSSITLSRPATILIVDDDVAMTLLLEDLLTEEGYSVHVVHSLAAATQHLVAQEPDVLVLDVQLPDGSGLDLCAQLQSRPATADLPILLMSAIDRSSQFVARGLDVGGHDMVIKPFNHDEFLARIRVLVRLRILQRRLIEQERERAMLATAGAAAHSLGQPLMAALGLTDILLHSELNGEQRQDMELLQSALQQMREIVHQIQDVQHYITQPYLDDSSDQEILDLKQARRPELPDFD